MILLVPFVSIILLVHLAILVYLVRDLVIVQRPRTQIPVHLQKNAKK